MKILKTLFAFAILSVVFGCKSQTNSKKENSDSIINQIAKKPFVRGEDLKIWVSNSNSHFQIVEVKDSENAAIYNFEKWINSFNNIEKKKIAFNKMVGRITKWDKYSITIQTKKFLFYYQIEKDTLFEMAEPGRVDTLIQVYNDSTIER